MLCLEHVTVSLRQEPLVEDLCLAIGPGEIVTLMGPSGCGKSTLLAWICGTLTDDFDARGRIRLASHDLTARPPEQRGLGMLFQDDLLFPHLSVGDNIAFGIPQAERGRRRRRTIVAEALESVGLGGFADRDPRTLSGGQRLRVSLSRVLVSAPRALLLDEPFSALDTELRAEIRSLVFSRARSQGLPVLLVTHDPEDARAAEGPVLRPWKTATSENALDSVE